MGASKADCPRRTTAPLPGVLVPRPRVKPVRAEQLPSARGLTRNAALDASSTCRWATSGRTATRWTVWPSVAKPAGPRTPVGREGRGDEGVHRCGTLETHWGLRAGLAQACRSIVLAPRSPPRVDPTMASHSSRSGQRRRSQRRPPTAADHQALRTVRHRVHGRPNRRYCSVACKRRARPTRLQAREGGIMASRREPKANKGKVDGL